MEAHIHDVSLSIHTQEHQILLLQDVFTVCQEHHLRIKLKKCELMREEMEYLSFDLGHGPWKPGASKMQPVQDMQIGDDPRKGLHDVRIFIGACNFYPHHIQNFTYSSALLTDLIKKTNPWLWTDKDEASFEELKKEISSTSCLGVPCPKGEIILVTEACEVRKSGLLYQFQELNPAELSRGQFHTSGLNCDGTLKHDHPANEWRLVPLGQWNRKWNQARSNNSTYDQELLGGMLVLSSLSRLLASNPIV